MLLVPERRLVVGRLDGVIAGSAQLVARAAQQRGAGLRRHADQRLRRALGARSRPRPRHRSSRSSGWRANWGSACSTSTCATPSRRRSRLYEGLGYRAGAPIRCYAQVDGPHRARPLLLQAARRAAALRPRDAVILFPAIDLKDGACVRLRARRDGAGHRVQRRSGGAGARLRRRRLRLAACRRSRRRLCRRAGQRRGGARRSAPRSRSRSSSAAASATAPRSSTGSRAASTGSCSAPPRCAIRRWCASAAGGLSRPHRRRHRRARRQGRGRGLGRDQRDRRASSSPAASRMPASPRSSTPTSTATARWPGSMSRRPPRSPRRSRLPVIASGGVASLADIAALEGPGQAGGIAGRRSAAARSTTGGSTRQRRCALPARGVASHAEDARHPLPRRQGRPGRQGRQLRRSRRCRRPGRAGAGL